MPAIHRLPANGIGDREPGKYADGAGLWFHKRADGGAQWFLRFTLHGKRREMGLGSFPGVTLKQAREAAEAQRVLVRQGIDPIRKREKERREERSKLFLLQDIARDAFESRKAELREDGKAGRWFSPLEIHVLPKLGTVPVVDLDQQDIRNALAPIWHTKADTARKAMNRLNICIRHAAALGLNVDLQAVEKAKLLLGAQRHKEEKIPSMSWQDVPAFYQRLDESVSQLALRLLILTAVRSKPLRFMRLD